MKEPKLTHKVKDALIEKLLVFIQELKRDDWHQAFTFYVANNFPKDQKFNKKARATLYEWIRKDSEVTKEAWNTIALRVFENESMSKQFIDKIFDDYLEKYINGLEKAFTPIIKKKKVSR